MTTQVAEREGYHLTDVRVTFDRAVKRADGVPSDSSIRLARETDIPALREIASISHRDTRFYFDGNFSREQCDALYARWIEVSCNGYAQAVWVAEKESVPVAYITCHLSEASGSIGLIAVAKGAQGAGLGRMLVHRSLAWFAEQGVSSVSVVTQARNIAAQRLYQRTGFLSSSVELYYHKWFA